MIALFIIPTLIWGSTWIAIKFQLGSVAPEASVLYRFILATFISFVYLKLKKLQLYAPLRIHKWLALQGLCNFSINYILTYYAENYVASGLIAVVFGLLPFFNALGTSFIFKQKLETKTILGIFAGIVGTVFIFHKQLFNFSLEQSALFGLTLGLIGTLFASAGNLSSIPYKKEKIPVLTTNAWAMLYGTIGTLIYMLFTGTSFTFDFSAPYVGSLLYLASFGTVIAFAFYYNLIHQVGAARAGYTTIMVHVIALIISSIFEDFRWELFSIIGVGISIFGNYLIISAKS